MRAAAGVLTVMTAALMFPVVSGAQENFLSNSLSPYPPGCATNSEVRSMIPGRESEVTSGTFRLLTIGDPVTPVPSRLTDIRVALVRRGCAEPGRSLLMVDLAFEDDGVEPLESIPLPRFRADRFGVPHGLRGVVEPNTWSAEGGSLAEGQSIRLFLDSPPFFEPGLDPGLVLTPEEYNGDWELLVSDALGGNTYRIDVPEYRDQLREDAYALNGRLSGLWVVTGVQDQGIFLGFHERANDPSGVLFLSWNTFGPSGENLWFAANGDYQVGDREVVMNVAWVRDGEFMGEKVATRSLVGTVTVTANSCNDLTMAWDLDYPGLEAGTRRLVRPFSLETQGFTCRDPQARLDALE